MADTWTPISGYTPQDYTDTMVFEMSSETKKVQTIMGQALVAGEENSQYIKFVLDRFWDGIDISGKTFSIEYALSGLYYGTSEAVNAEMTTDKVRFGWVVPETACCVSGKLLFVIRVESEDYILKSQIVEVSVYKTINVEDVVPEPTREAWYREFEARVEVAIDDAEAALAQAQQAVTVAETAAQNAQTAEDNAEQAAASAQIRYGSPLTAQTAEEMTDENRVYVYVGSESGYANGNWYYYDGTAWVSGGVYNGTGINTDTTLTQAGMAADAKATGDEISQIKEELNTLVPTELTLENVGYIKTNVDTISTTPTTPSSGGWRYIILECQQGDKFTVYGQYLGTAADLYTFVDASYNVLERSVDKSEDEYYYPVAPENSAYVVFQKNTAHPNRFWEGVSVNSKIEAVNEKVDELQSAVDGLGSQFFVQNLDGWVNKGIAPSTGAITANAKRLLTDIPYTALSCYVDTGYSFLVFGWDGDTYLGWYDGTEFVKTTMVPKTTELDISSIASYTLKAILIHGTTTAGAVNIDPSEGTHFYTKNKTDSLFNTKNAPADAYSVRESLTAIKSDTNAAIRDITGNEIIVPNISGYIKTNVSPVNASDITESTNIMCGVYSCDPLEYLTIKGDNVGSSAGYCVFLDASYNVLKRESPHSDYTFVQAPENSAYVVLQYDQVYHPNIFVRGKLVSKTIEDLSEQMDDLDGIIKGYLSTSYYESDDTQTIITNYDTLISMYDALVSANPTYITKNTLTHNDFTNYEYVFSMGDRNSGNGQRSKDASFEKPLVLIMAGTHGHERCSIMGLYLFAKALCESPELSPLRNGLTIKMIPVVCPSGYNNNSRVNANGVNINRNFNANWVLTPDDGMNYSGASPADQDETQVVQAWMDANTDAVIEIDWHNSAYANEVCYFATCIGDGFAVNAKKGYFYGLDRITSHWINDRGIADNTTIYGYTGVDHANGTSYAYARSINLKGCLYETSWNVGSYGKDTPETIGVNAEAFCASMKGIMEKYIDVL